MNKNVKTNKQNFRTKLMNKTNFLVLQEIIIDKMGNLIKKPYFKKDLIKENQSRKSIVCIVSKGRMWVSTVLLLF